MAMRVRRTRHKLEPQCDQSCKQVPVQQTWTTLTTKKRQFAVTSNMLLCLSLCIRVITSLVVNVPTYLPFTCMWITRRSRRFSHCENGFFEVLSLHLPVGNNRPPSAVNGLSVKNRMNSWEPFRWDIRQSSVNNGLPRSITSLCLPLLSWLSLNSWRNHQAIATR